MTPWVPVFRGGELEPLPQLAALERADLVPGPHDKAWIATLSSRGALSTSNKEELHESILTLWRLMMLEPKHGMTDDVWSMHVAAWMVCQACSFFLSFR
jgi:hypothetical protein